jgi:hypothetical protein
MKPCVFIHTNHRQMLGAVVSEYSLKRNSAHGDEFDVKFIHTEDKTFMHAREGQLYLRDGDKRPWRNDDLQSFTPLRFMPPELMGYEGRALVIDPDVFAAGDVWELLSRDMEGHAIICRPKSGSKGRRGALATSVMLLDCAKLTHWNVAETFGARMSGTTSITWTRTRGCSTTRSAGRSPGRPGCRLTSGRRTLSACSRRVIGFVAHDAPFSATIASLANTSNTRTRTRSGSSSVWCVNVWTRGL